MKLLIIFISLIFSINIISSLCYGNSTDNENKKNSQELYWIDHDLGFDPDDFMAMVVAAKLWGNKIIGTSSNLYHPMIKAKFSKIIFQKLGIQIDNCHTGVGIYQGKEEQFFKQYPKWPPQFGAPYPKQAKSISTVLGAEWNKSVECDLGATDALISAIHIYPHRLTVVVTGPLSNIAKAIKKDPSIINKIKKVVVMGGWSEKKDGSIKRPSYNSLMDMKAAQYVYGIKNLNIMVVNSNTIKRAHLKLTPNEYQRFQKSKTSSDLGQIFIRDIRNWASHVGNKKGTLALYDPVTIMIADSSKWALEVRNMEFKFHDKKGVHMLHPKAGSLIEVNKKEGHIKVVTKFKDPQQMRQKIVNLLFEILK